MRSRLPLIVLTLVMAMTAVMASQSSPAEMSFEAARKRQVVDGDLKGAIVLYEQAVKQAGNNRPLAVRALLAIADAYQTLGNAQARDVYQTIIRRYADQTGAVATAQARLGIDPQKRAAGQHAAWTGPYVDLFGRVSPDGRFVTFVDWGRSNNLAVHDTVTNTDRSMTGLTPHENNPAWKYQGESEWSTFSRDGKHVAFVWLPPGGPPELRVMPLTGTSLADSKRILVAGDDVQGLQSLDWSADGRWIAMAVSKIDGTSQIVLVRVADGSMSVLKSVSWRGPERIFFSPDSQFIAYDLPSSDDTDDMDVFAMPIDHSREIHVVQNAADDRLAGWSPDGTRLLFISNRSSSAALWGQNFAAGKPAGDPVMLQSNVQGTSLGVTVSGALYVYKDISDVDVRTMSIDLAAARVTSQPRSFDRGLLPGVNVPSWSPNGKFLGYQVGGGDPSRAAIAVRTVTSGEARRLPGLYATDPRWSPDGRTFVTGARDRRGRNGVYTVDVETGSISLVVAAPGFTSSPKWSVDGSKIYYKKGPNPALNGQNVIVERDLKTGTERDIFARGQIGIFEPSPDGASIAVRVGAVAASNILVVPINGGEPREVLPATRGGPRTMAWTPDGRALLVLKRPNEGGQELWLIPVNGGSPRKFEMSGDSGRSGLPFNSGFGLSPDGKQIAFLTGSRSAEVWKYENFLPVRSSR